MVDDLAGPSHWDERTWRRGARIPSRRDVGIAGLLDLLNPHVSSGCMVLEVGCAPGDFLLWCALVKKAHVCGVDYAPKSYKHTIQQFANAKVTADIRFEDFLRTSFEPASFDVVYSFGVVEHYTDPGPMVRKHLEMLRPGGLLSSPSQLWTRQHLWLAEAEAKRRNLSIA